MIDHWCSLCGQKWQSEQIDEDHRSVCPSTAAELERVKRQNAKWLPELVALRAMRDALVKLLPCADPAAAEDIERILALAPKEVES